MIQSRFVIFSLTSIFMRAAFAVDAPAMPSAAPPTSLAAPTMESASTPGSTASPSFSAVPAAPVDYKKFRDPFKEPVINEILELRSDLERYAVTDFRVLAVITGPLRMRAMIVAPDNKTHYVSEKMKMGLRDGVIVKITTKTVVVREKVVNPLGDIELFDTEIGIDQQAGAGSSTQ